MALQELRRATGTKYARPQVFHLAHARRYRCHQKLAAESARYEGSLKIFQMLCACRVTTRKRSRAEHDPILFTFFRMLFYGRGVKKLPKMLDSTVHLFLYSLPIMAPWHHGIMTAAPVTEPYYPRELSRRSFATEIQLPPSQLPSLRGGNLSDIFTKPSNPHLRHSPRYCGFLLLIDIHRVCRSRTLEDH